MKKRLACACLIAVAVAACSRPGGNECEEIGSEPIARLDLCLTSPDSASAVMADSRMREALKAYAMAVGADTSSLTDFAGSVGGSASVEVFAPDVASCLPELSSESARIGMARSRWNRLGADGAFPSCFAAIVSPYNQSVVMVDSIVLIATNHFLGADYPGYEGFVEARRVSRRPDRIAVETVEALVRSQFPAPSAGAALLEVMVYEGAVLNAVGYLTGEESFAMLAGIDEAAFSKLKSDERSIWRSMVEKEMLFSTDPALVGRMVSSTAPIPSVLPQGLPSGPGRYVGYKIVKALLKNDPELTAGDILQPEVWADRQILSRAAYRP
ncbi:MAG: DUF2268 domain-containing protein [Paramuribaculum sp.]|nr:DUF2268 domain-containing protein [Paramuribaculum sp.]